MRRSHWITAGLCGLGVFGWWACGGSVDTGGEAVAAPAKAAGGKTAAELAFRDAVHLPPEGWDGPVFELSHDYPSADPGTCDPSVCTWLAIDVDFSETDWTKGNWKAYIQAIKDYVARGQDLNLPNDKGFQTSLNGKAEWFHVPWMAYDPNVGREFIHGCTNERTSHLSDFFPGEGHGVNSLRHLPDDAKTEYEKELKAGFETWAVGFYNAWGGYAIGQAFPKTGEPAIGEYMGRKIAAGLPFSEGTVVAKLLTTTAPVEIVPYLKNSAEWQVHRHTLDLSKGNDPYRCERQVQTTRLIQMDIAVVDLRSPTRWVYGTFSYDGDAPGETVWDRMVPVGAQWGSDPFTYPAVPKAESKPISATSLNPDVRHQHFGCEKRLAGPVDNEKSSCMSCHATAFVAPGGGLQQMGVNTPPSFGFPGMCDDYSLQNAYYFADRVPPMAYDGGQYPQSISLDTSLQLWVAFQQFGQFNVEGAPSACTDKD